LKTECKASSPEEPGAGIPHAGIRAGGARQRASLPRYALWTSLNAVTNIYTANELNQYFLISNHVNPVNPVQISPAYDLDGNMTWDGRFSYAYDAENRLVAAYSNGLCVVSNAYDHMSRRVLKFTPEATHTYIYDGWNLVAETITASHLPPTTTSGARPLRYAARCGWRWGVAGRPQCSHHAECRSWNTATEMGVPLFGRGFFPRL
jgi:hypothetical protein